MVRSSLKCNSGTRKYDSKYWVVNLKGGLNALYFKRRAQIGLSLNHYTSAGVARFPRSWARAGSFNRYELPSVMKTLEADAHALYAFHHSI